MPQSIDLSSFRYVCKLCCIFILAGCGQATARLKEANTVSKQEQACTEFRSQLPADMISDFISVPENWDQPEGRTIKVFYYTRRSTSLERDGQVYPRIPVAFFNGGPGGDSHSSYEILKDNEAAMPLRFVYIDQRGTGCSDPFPKGETAENLRRLTLYGSRAIVKDAEAIRKTLLGADQRWQVFGQSYGAFIVHRYIELAPEGLSAAFAHGFGLTRDPLSFLTQRIASQKEAGAKYLAAYPDDAERLTKLRQLIPKDLCYKAAPDVICGPGMLDGATQLIGFSDEWPYLHSLFTALLNPDGTLHEPLLREFVTTYILSDSDSSLAISVLSQTEVSPGITTLEDPTGCQRVLQKLAAEFPDSWPLHECRMFLAMTPMRDAHERELTQRLSELAPDPIDLDRIEKNLRQRPDLRFHLYSGAQDSFMPPAVFQDERKQLAARVLYQEFPNSGHEGFYSEAQVWRDLIGSGSQP